MSVIAGDFRSIPVGGQFHRLRGITCGPRAAHKEH